MATRKTSPKPKSQSKPRSPARGAKVPALPAEVAALVGRHPPAMKKALLALRAQVFAAAPGASDAVAWRMPMITFGGKHLVGYEAFKAHCTLFPMSAGVVEQLAPELGDRVGGRGSIHFTPDDPLPAALVKRVVKLRLGELAAKAAARAKR
jgi:uncharacterized protein YdhG (YjbR/CyaY superfamily)